MLSEISHRLFSKELNFVFEFFFALCQKSLALEVGWSKQSGFCMVIFVNLVWTITSNLDMILGCNLLRIVYNYFYFKKIPTFCFQSSWLLWNLSLKRAPQPNFYGFHMICPFFLIFFLSLLSNCFNLRLAQVRYRWKDLDDHFLKIATFQLEFPYLISGKLWKVVSESILFLNFPLYLSLKFFVFVKFCTIWSCQTKIYDKTFPTTPHLGQLVVVWL